MKFNVKKLSKTQVVIGILAVVAGITAYLIYKHRNELKNPKEAKFYNSNDFGYTPADFPLKYGSKGLSVKALQTLLNAYPPLIFPAIEVDGVFGKDTEKLCLNKLGVKEVTFEKWQKIQG